MFVELEDGEGPPREIGLFDREDPVEGLAFLPDGRIFGVTSDELVEIDPLTGLSLSLDTILEDGSTPLPSFTGLTYDEEIDRLVGITVAGGVYELDPEAGDATELLSVDGLVETPQSLGIGGDDFLIGGDGGRVLTVGIPASFGMPATRGEGPRAVAQALPAGAFLSTVGDTGDAAVGGLAVISAPEPGAAGALLGSLASLAGLRRSRVRRRGRSRS